jgi:Bacterial RNA polymerase, alpha chain C terminal domain
METYAMTTKDDAQLAILSARLLDAHLAVSNLPFDRFRDDQEAMRNLSLISSVLMDVRSVLPSVEGSVAKLLSLYQQVSDAAKIISSHTHSEIAEAIQEIRSLKVEVKSINSNIDKRIENATSALRKRLDRLEGVAPKTPGRSGNPSVREDDVRLRISLEGLCFSVRTGNCLQANEFPTVGDLVRKSQNEMLRIPNFGRKSLAELRVFLASIGLEFGMDVLQVGGDDAGQPLDAAA